MKLDRCSFLIDVYAAALSRTASASGGPQSSVSSSILFLQVLPISHLFLPLRLPQRFNWSNVVVPSWKLQIVFLPWGAQ